MKKACVICGREFEAWGKAKACSVECQRLRRAKATRQYYWAHRAEEKARRREHREHVKNGVVTGEQLALELAYWNYLIDKYGGQAWK